MKVRQLFLARIYKTIASMQYSILVASLFSVGISNTVTAAPGQLEDSPLFLVNRAEPNIFFMLDDSNSMDTEMMSPFEYVPSWGGVMSLTQSGSTRSYRFVFGRGSAGSSLHSSYYTNNRSMIPHFSGIFDQADTTGTTPVSTVYTSPSTSMQGVWRARNYQYNPMYYDPNTDYSFWAGVNSSGVPFTNITDGSSFPATVNAPFDPYTYTGTASDALNLVGNISITARLPRNANTGTSNGNNEHPYTYYPAFYNVWDDTNGDNIIDATDNFRKIEIRSTSTQCPATADSDADQFATGCIKRTPAAEIQNFANWFAYYRKRESVAKFGVSQVIDQGRNVRMGIATIHNDASNEEATLASMNNDAATGNKRTLLNALYRMDTTGGTPLHQAIQLVGNYYSCSGTTPFGNPGSCGIQVATPVEDSPGICQQNYMIMVTDGDYSPTSHPTPFQGDADSDDTITNATYYPAGTAYTGDLQFDGAPYSDTFNESLADITMYYYERDLSPLPNKVPMLCGVDENPMQHMVSYILGYGVVGSLDPDTDLPTPKHPNLGYASGCPASTTTPPSPAWPTNASTFSNIIDDVVHAAYNGRGDYLSAQDPQELTSGLQGTLRNIISRTGAASAVALNSSALSTGSTAYFAKFNSSSWQGEFSAYPILADSSINFSAPIWEAHDLLENRTAERSIVTFNRASASYGAVAFRPPLSSLPATHQADLRTSPTNTVDSVAVGEARLNYIRGDHACEQTSEASYGTCATGKTFRDRIFLESPQPEPPNRYKLGDIIHSSAVFVGAPSAQIPGSDPFGANGKRYRDFKNGVSSASAAFTSTETALTRNEMLYVGSNDGMLHAFDASNGDEVWAYIPGSLFHADDSTYDFGPGLHSLTETTYEHRYYVDLTPKIADAYIQIGAHTSPNWHTVLVGGLRGGGRGLFAIDVTDPDELINAAPGTTRETALAKRVMWEFTSDDDRDLGMTYSEPQIVPIGDSSGTIEWYVVFANGYNSLNGNPAFTPLDPPTNPDNDAYDLGNNTHSSKLFILKLEGPKAGTAGRWELGVDYWKLDTADPLSSTSPTEADRNGLSTPALADSDGDSIADTAYAGDLNGNMWNFNIAGVPSATPTGGWTLYKLFKATDAAGTTGTNQPITAKPALMRNTRVASVSGTNTPNLIVSFGTGSYLTQGDLADNQPQSFYTVWDSGPSQAPLDNSDLTEQGITTDTAGGDTYRIISPTTLPVNYTIGANYGWFHNLPTSKERVINEATTDGIATAYITIIPSEQPCSFGGTSWLMLVDAFTGTALSYSPYDVDNNGYIDSDDVTSGGSTAAGIGFGALAFGTSTGNIDNGAGTPGDFQCPPGTIKKINYITLSDSGAPGVPYCAIGKIGRQSWRELDFNAMTP